MKHDGHYMFQFVIDYWGSTHYTVLQTFKNLHPVATESTWKKPEGSHNAHRAQLQTRCNGNLTFQCIIDYWGVHSDTGPPGAILRSYTWIQQPCNKKVNKQVEVKIRNF